MGNVLRIIGGTVCVGLGILGIFLPILPTTPFLLLAAFCYGRGSERFYHWLVDRSWVGGYIRSYREDRDIPLKQEMLITVLLWSTVGMTIGFVAPTGWLKTLLAVVAAGLMIHMILIKNWRSETSIPTKEAQFLAPADVEAF